ncbi:MAG: esterase-like activity of phytase family protein [Rhodothalassiaceae bacterium]
MAEMHALTRIALVLAAALAGYFAAAVFTDEAPVDGPVTVASRPLDLYTPPRPERARRTGALEFLAGLELKSDRPEFGGFSGLAVDTQGTRILALSDGAFWLSARLHLEDGLPVSIADARMAPLRGPDGPLVAKEDRDAEALIVVPGGFVVAFEHHQRLLFYPDTAPWQDIPAVLHEAGEPVQVPAQVLDNPRNGGLEAGVRLADGRLLLFSEERRAGPGLKRAWLLDPGGHVAALAYAAPKDFGATAAARLPEGDILLLLRNFTRVRGVTVLVQRIPAGAIAAGSVLRGEELARFAPPLTVDNLEGLAVRRDTSGRTLLYLISDDNFSPLQRTILLVFALVSDGREMPGP